MNTVNCNPYPLSSTKSIGTSSLVYIAFCVFYLSGSNSAMHNYIQVSLFGIWCLFALLEDAQSLFSAFFNKTTAFLLLFLLYYFFTSIFVADIPYTLTYIAIFFMLYSCYIPYLYYRERGRYKEIKLITFTSLAGWAFWASSAIAFYQVNPSAARTLAADFTAFDNLYIGGGYAIAIGSALLFVWLFSLLCKGYLDFNKRNKVLIIIFLSLLFFLLIKTESTTTLLACIVGSVFSVFELLKNSKKKGIRLLLFFLLIILAIFIINGGLNTFGSSLVSATDSGADDNVILRRFNRIGEKFLATGSGTTTENYVDERWGLVVMSWDTFCQYPIFGMGYSVGNIFSRLETSGVGTHSEICDMLAQHGIVGVFFLVKYFINALKCMGNRIANNGFVVTLLILALMNPFRYFHGFFSILLLLPFVELLINYKQDEHIQNIY